MNTDTKAPAAITVRCWIGETKLDGEDEFRTELADSYAVSLVRSRPAGLGGGLYQLLVEWVSHLTLADAIKVLLECGRTAYRDICIHGCGLARTLHRGSYPARLRFPTP